MKDEAFVSISINDSSVDLDKFPPSKVRQLAKKMKALKATAWHTKQVAGDPQVAEINLMRQQQTPPTEQTQEKNFQVKATQSQATYQ